MVLYIVVPCYNEEEVLPETSRILSEKLDALIGNEQISSDSRIVFVDDGSRDRTWELISGFNAKDPERFGGVKLSRNRGHQNALLAGLMTIKDKCDAAISLDADLQDDPDCIEKMVAEYKKGSDIVYGVRRSRKTDSFFKRTTAVGFYRFMSGMGVEMVYNHADCRLMSRRALGALSEFGEVNLFLRGLVPLIGFKTAKVEYDRHERLAGESKYPLKKMLAFAWQGIVSMSDAPMRLITSLGIFMCLVSALMWLIALIKGVLSGIGGMYLLSCLIVTVGGLQITACGIVGRYVAKSLDEVKRRPRYFIDTVL